MENVDLTGGYGWCSPSLFSSSSAAASPASASPAAASTPAAAASWTASAAAALGKETEGMLQLGRGSVRENKINPGSEVYF